mgnify:FL=1
MMEWTKMKQRRLIIAGSAAAFALASSNALADTPSADLDVKATLTAAMTIECGEALDFGELIVPAGDRGGSDDSVKIEADDGAQVELVDGSQNVSRDGDSQPGKCTISGGDGEQKIKINLPESIALGSNDKLSIVPEDNKEGEEFELDGSGEGSVYIGGELKISNNLSSDDFQEYSQVLTVKVDDDP